MDVPNDEADRMISEHIMKQYAAMDERLPAVGFIGLR